MSLIFLIGVAGSGKTMLLEALRHAYTVAGLACVNIDDYRGHYDSRLEPALSLNAIVLVAVQDLTDIRPRLRDVATKLERHEGKKEYEWICRQVPDMPPLCAKWVDGVARIDLVSEQKQALGLERSRKIADVHVVAPKGDDRKGLVADANLNICIRVKEFPLFCYLQIPRARMIKQDELLARRAGQSLFANHHRELTHRVATYLHERYRKYVAYEGNVDITKETRPLITYHIVSPKELGSGAEDRRSFGHLVTECYYWIQRRETELKKRGCVDFQTFDGYPGCHLRHRDPPESVLVLFRALGFVRWP